LLGVELLARTIVFVPVARTLTPPHALFTTLLRYTDLTSHPHGVNLGSALLRLQFAVCTGRVGPAVVCYGCRSGPWRRLTRRTRTDATPGLVGSCVGSVDHEI
jgi:hypothetical protein